MRDIPTTQTTCPIDLVMSVLGNKWSMLILRDLFQGRKRTSELMRSLAGISPRTLSERLRELEEFGLLNRTVYAEIPPRVEYGLTEAGLDLRGVMIALEQVGQRWHERKIVELQSDSPCLHCQADVSSRRCAALQALDNQTENSTTVTSKKRKEK